MPITLFDGLLLFIMLISAFLAMVRGFVREVLSIASWVVAAIAAYMGYKPLMALLAPYIANEYIALAVSVGSAFIVTFIIVSYITIRVSDFVLDSRIGALDRTLGFIFGAARGYILVAVAMVFFDWFLPPQEQPRWVADAKSKPALEATGRWLVAALPEDSERDLLDRLRRQTLDQPTTPAVPGENIEQDTGYSDTSRTQLDRLSTTATDAE